MAGKRSVFVSYAHEGKGAAFIKSLKNCIKAIQLDIDIWSDEEISAGDQWFTEITKALDQAFVVILLIDWSFLGSKFVKQVELPHTFSARDRTVIPVLMEPCLYDPILPEVTTRQMEPENSLRQTLDPERKTFSEIISVANLDDTGKANLLTALGKRLLSLASQPPLTYPTTEPPPTTPSPRKNIWKYRGYLERGDDLSSNYMDLQLNIFHSEFDVYRVELRYSIRQPDENSSLSYYGLVTLPRENATEHSGQPILDALLSDSLHQDSDKIKVSNILSDAISRSRTSNVPLQFRLGIHANAGELHEIDWETLPVTDETPLIHLEDIMFSRMSLSTGMTAVECLTRACKDLNALCVFADDSTGETRISFQSQQEILGRMENCVKELATDKTNSASLIKPEKHVFLDELKKPYDVLYLACEGKKKGNEYYLTFQGKELSRAEISHHFKQVPAPRLVILISANKLAGLEEEQGHNNALLHFAPLFNRAGSASVITCNAINSENTWNSFLSSCFQLLKLHGHVPGAVYEASHKNQNIATENPCSPVLLSRIKASRLWYSPGFVSELTPEDNWLALLNSLNDKRFCPVIGPGIYYRLQQARLEMAREIAYEYGYPLSFSNRINLPKVLQYAQTLRSKSVTRRNLGEKIRKRWQSIGRDYILNNTDCLYSLSFDIALQALEAEPTNPYNLLAKLPVGLYLSATLDPFLEAALYLASKSEDGQRYPIQKHHLFDFSKINAQRQEMKKESKLPVNKFEPSNPLLVQLFGSYKTLNTATITEDEYLDFLVNFNQKMTEIKGPLGGHLNWNSDLIFLGFKWNSLGFRVLFRALKQYAANFPDNTHHIAVQIDPDDDETIQPLKMVEYLRRYFSGKSTGGGAPVSLYWGSTSDFLEKLSSRYNNAGD